MWFCIMGALLCSSPLTPAAFSVPGPLSYAPQVSTYNYAWNYAAYWGVPILGAGWGAQTFTFGAPLEQRGFTW